MAQRRSLQLRRDDGGAALKPPAGPTEFDSALKSDFFYIPEELLAAQTRLYLVDSSHTSVQVSYDPDAVPDDTLFGPPVEIAVVRSPSGLPATMLDGISLFRGAPQRPAEGGWVTFPDLGLAPGKWHYYGLFAKYFSAGNSIWLRVAAQAILLPAEYGYSERLWAKVPEWYRRQDARGTAETGLLRRLVEVLGYETDLHRTWVSTLGDLWDVEKLSSLLLPALGDLLGQPVEYAAGDKRYRNVLISTLTFRKEKGTDVGIEGYLRAITGYRTTAYTGLNLFLTPNESEQRDSLGMWTSSLGTATASRPTGDGSANGPAPGVPYLRLTHNGATSQQPALRHGAGTDPTTMIPVTAGHTYKFSATVRSSVSGALQVRIGWFSPSGTSLSSNTYTIGAVGTAWARDLSGVITAPAGAGFAVLFMERTAATTTAGLTSDWYRMMFVDLAYRPTGVPGKSGTPPLSGNNPGQYDDTGYYEAPRQVNINVYPQRINLALNADFELDNLPAGAWLTADFPTYGLLPIAYTTYADIIDAEPGDSETTYEDLRTGYAPMTVTWTVAFETIYNRLRMNPATTGARVAQVRTGWFPVVEGNQMSAAVTAWTTLKTGTHLRLRIVWFKTNQAGQELVIDGLLQEARSNLHNLTDTAARYELINAIVPPGAAFGRMYVEMDGPSAYIGYIQKALIEERPQPGDWFDGGSTDGDYGDFFYVGIPHQSYSVYYQNFRSFVNGVGGSDRVSTLLQEMLPPGRDYSVRTAASGLY